MSEIHQKEASYFSSCPYMIKKYLTPLTHTGYLGILMDHHLSWDKHLKMLKKKLSTSRQS